MSIALITSLYGDLDELRDPPECAGVDDYIAVTDRTHDVTRWRHVIEPRRHLSDRLASKIPKCIPHNYTACDFVVWVDASATIRDDCAEWAVDQLDARELAQFRHPERDDVGDEAKVSAGLRKYAGLMVEEQAAHYIAEGFPRHWGLWATGLMVRRRHAWSTMFGKVWLAEQVRWSYQDQVSEPYVLWRMGQTRPVELDGSLWHDPHINFGGHRTDD